ncbi:MAG: hypothetical protein ACD_74C00242G0001 [uncultured bacterium]|nr:MAG: hypothetical protein ACD_74C00242G0001 [uncultured bacterium]
MALQTALTGEQREFLEIIDRSAAHLLQVINDLLDFSKIEAHKLDIAHSTFNLQKTIHDVMQELAISAQKKNLQLLSQIGPDVPELLIGDAFRLRQIVTNLLGNSIKFTESGHISLTVTRKGEHDGAVELLFSLSDTGIGIPEEQQQKIFEAFSQVDGTLTRKFGGTGLGLSISSRLAQLMGGRIWLESTPAVGSTFFFTILCEKPSENRVSSPTLEKNLFWQKDAEPAKHEVPGHSPTLHILLAEDNIVNQKVAQGLLEKAGHCVVVANNGREALEKYGAEDFDLILMDVQMPEMDGFEATTKIRAHEQGSERHIPIIALTAHAMKGYREKCLAAGMDGYVSKPFNIKKLADLLHDITPHPLRDKT